MHVEAKIKDPHPGRCGCQSFNQATGQYERCLGYADEPHICSWEKKPMAKAAVSVEREDREYPPWVSPLDV